jgi:hypothetical protein
MKPKMMVKPIFQSVTTGQTYTGEEIPSSLSKLESYKSVLRARNAPDRLIGFTAIDHLNKVDQLDRFRKLAKEQERRWRLK